MKTTRSFFRAALGAGVVSSSFFILTAHAGPGLAHRTATPAAPTVVAVPERIPAVGGCPDATIVTATVVQSPLRNGRGTPQAVASDPQQICRHCPVTTSEMRSSWHNERGPLVSVSRTRVGVDHVCTDCGTGIAASAL